MDWQWSTYRILGSHRVPSFSAVRSILLFRAFSHVLIFLGHVWKPCVTAATGIGIGIGAEYVGRINVAMADGKEVAAATLLCAAEAEGYVGVLMWPMARK